MTYSKEFFELFIGQEIILNFKHMRKQKGIITKIDSQYADCCIWAKYVGQSPTYVDADYLDTGEIAIPAMDKILNTNLFKLIYEHSI